MNLIRNGGFERGTTDFWEVISSETISADSSEHVYGNYSGKVISSAGVMQGIRSKEYIEVKEGELINMMCWLKTSLVIATRFRVYEYDEDLALVDDDYAGRSSGGAGWLVNYGQYLVNPGVAYIKIAVTAVFTGAAQTMHVDGMSVVRLEMNHTFRLTRQLIDATDRTTSGNSIADAVEMLGGIEYYAELSVTSFAGTSPTMDIEIREYDIVGYTRVLGSFTQVTGAVDQRIGIARPISQRLHAIWTMGGVVTDADFKINVIGVR